jgi:hypothetical protein
MPVKCFSIAASRACSFVLLCIFFFFLFYLVTTPID